MASDKLKKSPMGLRPRGREWLVNNIYPDEGSFYLPSRHINDCFTETARLRALGGRRVSSESPSRVWYQGKGRAWMIGTEENNILPVEESLICLLAKSTSLQSMENANLNQQRFCSKQVSKHGKLEFFSDRTFAEWAWLGIPLWIGDL